MTYSRYTISPIYKFCSLDEPSPLPRWEGNYDPAACWICYKIFITCRKVQQACEDYNLVFEQIVKDVIGKELLVNIVWIPFLNFMVGCWGAMVELVGGIYLQRQEIIL